MLSLGAAAVADPAPRAEDLGAAWTPADTAQFEVGPPEHRFRVLVSVPSAEPPAQGYGVIYALDAGWTFGTLRDVVGLRALGGAQGTATPTVIVGIGWPGASLVDLDRRGPDLVARPPQGGGPEATLEVIETELIPAIEDRLPVDPARRMLLGHSFGGAFALAAHARRPGLFSHVAAGSPSIWTDPEGLLGEPDPNGAEVLVTIGGLEAPAAAEAANQPPDRVARLRERDMTGRARQMAEALGAKFVTFPGETHGSSVSAFLARAVAFLWQAG
ncbi:alpha/beta hydrolase [Salipiger mucosus]|uniref:Esterase n=1 Tax=Salipiger mucosus DSM 16094 TaxID=1123237 RepID=S9RRU0_9RHOB|nr:alpha/beta hydrolase-fold protein [Salipiger mucosus]EPX76664.1 hypothetical protein Salmuc_00496 [Salipiger mucosus DSM 16094]